MQVLEFRVAGFSNVFDLGQGLSEGLGFPQGSALRLDRF